MKRFLRRTAACVTLFCANPRAFLRAVSRPDSPQGRQLRRLLRE